MEYDFFLFFLLIEYLKSMRVHDLDKTFVLLKVKF